MSEPSPPSPSEQMNRSNLAVRFPIMLKFGRVVGPLPRPRDYSRERLARWAASSRRLHQEREFGILVIPAGMDIDML